MSINESPTRVAYDEFELKVKTQCDDTVISHYDFKDITVYAGTDAADKDHTPYFKFSSTKTLTDCPLTLKLYTKEDG